MAYGIANTPNSLRKIMDERLKEYQNKNVSRETLTNEKSIFWSPNRILSYNCLFNFIVGSTGCGKGFAITELLIRKAIYEGKEFVHLRRSDVEQKLAKKKFFDDMIDHNKFPGYHFRIQNDEYQCIEVDPETEEPYDGGCWKTIGYARYLSGARQQKSVNTPKVKYIWFDEFILPKKDWGKYVPDEVNTFLRFYDTVARMRDVIVFFVSNAECLVNPYFLYFNIHIPYNTDICRIKEDVAFEKVNNPAFQEMRRNTRFGKLIEGTEYGAYAIDNEFGVDRHSDIAKLDKTFNYQLTLVTEGKEIGVYKSNEKQMMILSFKADSNWRPRMELKFTNGKLNKMAYSTRNYHYVFKYIFSHYISGYLYYESISVKQLMEPLICKF